METYDMKLVCCMCGKQYGTKPGAKTPNQESHGFCGDDCVKVYLIDQGVDPQKILEEEV